MTNCFFFFKKGENLSSKKPLLLRNYPTTIPQSGMIEMRHKETMKVSTKCTSVTFSLFFFALISNGTGGGVLPYKKLMGMCWMGSHFQDWIDYNRVA